MFSNLGGGDFEDSLFQLLQGILWYLPRQIVPTSGLYIYLYSLGSDQTATAAYFMNIVPGQDKMQKRNINFNNRSYLSSVYIL